MPRARRGCNDRGGTLLFFGGFQTSPPQENVSISPYGLSASCVCSKRLGQVYFWLMSAHLCFFDRFRPTLLFPQTSLPSACELRPEHKALRWNTGTPSTQTRTSAKSFLPRSGHRRALHDLPVFRCCLLQFLMGCAGLSGPAGHVKLGVMGSARTASRQKKHHYYCHRRILVIQGFAT